MRSELRAPPAVHRQPQPGQFTFARCNMLPHSWHTKEFPNRVLAVRLTQQACEEFDGDVRF